MQVGGVIKRQSGDPLSIDLSTAAGASGPLEPVPELEADVRAQKPEMVSLYREVELALSTMIPAPCRRQYTDLCSLLVCSQRWWLLRISLIE